MLPLPQFEAPAGRPEMIKRICAADCGGATLMAARAARTIRIASDNKGKI
jgi:hypothetical protein